MRRELLDVLFTLLLIVFIGWTTFEARTWPERARLFPWVVGFPILTLMLVQLVSQLRVLLTVPKPVDSGEHAEIDPSVARRRTLGIAGWMLGFAGIIWAAGFGVGGTLSTLLYLKLAAREKWPISLAITLGTGVFFWILIALLHVPFPRGFVGDLLPV